MKHRILAALLPLFLLLFTLPACAEVYISEVMAANATWKDGHAYDWVEVTNSGNSTVNLSGWHLSDNPSKPEKWSFPAGTKLKGGASLIVYCTGEAHDAGRDGVYYTPFKLSAKGDQALLTDADGQTVSLVEFPQQYANISWGRPANGGDYGYFAKATPGKKNGSTVFAARTEKPSLLTEAGFYTGSVTVQAMAPEGAVLRYTADGETPDEKSKKFPAGGLKLTKTTSLRVAAFRDGEVASEAVCATFFINEDIPVAVVSLTTDDAYLFNKKTGALVKGTGAIPNYDKELEYPVSIEYFDTDGRLIISQMGTFTCSGHSARINKQKSIAIYARKVFGNEYFDFNPFPHRGYTQYKSLLLRSTNSDAHSERLRDVVFSSLAEPLDLCYQDAAPIVVFINGQYWGHYNLREKINKYMVAQWEGIDLEDEDAVDGIDILARTGSDRFTQHGDNADWEALCAFCKTKDLNDPANLTWVTDRLDVDNLFTHAAYEIISGNSDITNVRMYRIPGGKWKYLLFDVEASFGSGSDSDTIPLENYIKPVSAKYAAFRHEPLNALLAVPEMKARFLTRFAEVLDLSFTWPTVQEKFDYWEGVLEQLLPRHNARWKNLTMTRWRKNVNATRYYARVRPKKIVSMLAKRMHLTNAEVETYFGDIQRKLETVNVR